MKIKSPVMILIGMLSLTVFVPVEAEQKKVRNCETYYLPKLREHRANFTEKCKYWRYKSKTSKYGAIYCRKDLRKKYGCNVPPTEPQQEQPTCKKEPAYFPWKDINPSKKPGYVGIVQVSTIDSSDKKA